MAFIAWWKNPGRKTGLWRLRVVGQTENYSADRVAVADVNGDGRTDIMVTEESWQSGERVARMFCFYQGELSGELSWDRRSILTACSMNSLDVADLDNDGKGQFMEHVIDRGKESHLGTLLFDMDCDGDLDIISIAWDDYRFLHLWRNDAVKFN